MPGDRTVKRMHLSLQQLGGLLYLAGGFGLALYGGLYDLRVVLVGLPLVLGILLVAYDQRKIVHGRSSTS